MAYYGIASNLVQYLTRKLHEGTVKSSNNVTNWVGTVWMTPILGAYIADAHLGRYWTFVIASGIYLVVKSRIPNKSTHNFFLSFYFNLLSK
jgi:peptide/histidine transporter 3/4